MNVWAISVLSIFLAVSSAYAESPDSIIKEFDKLTPEQIEHRLPSSHPAAYLIYAGRLWGAGKKDEAVFWYYAGQLRYRFYLMASPQDPSGDPALFSALMQALGAPINEYAGGDSKKWAAQMDAVLAWDDHTPNEFTSKSDHKKELIEARSGLTKLKDYVSTHQEEIIAQREQNGIGQVGVTNGVYIEEKKEKMPKDWPPLAPHSTVASILGVYQADSAGMLGPILFFDDQHKVLRAKTIELSATDGGSLLAIAKDGDTELLRRTIPTQQADDAVSFEEQETALQAGLSEGGVRKTIFLRSNTEGDLIIQRDSVTEGKYPNKTMPMKLSYTWWNRVQRAENQKNQPN